MLTGIDIFEIFTAPFNDTPECFCIFCILQIIARCKMVIIANNNHFLWWKDEIITVYQTLGLEVKRPS